MKTSHSAIQRYKLCPESYNLHYNKKIRPKFTSSALLFGDANDQAFNEINNKTGNDPYEAFLKRWTYAPINKIETYIPTATNIVYSVKDFDAELLIQADYEEVDFRVEKREIQRFVYEDLVEKRKDKGWERLTEEEKKYYNFLNWLCMKRKALYFIEAYKKKISPNIKKVHAVQKAFIISNGAGDEYTGYIDLEADYEGYDTPIVFDHKTSSIPYEYDSASKSSQLASYLAIDGEALGTRLGGFIVFNKRLKKNTKMICKSCGHSAVGSRAKTCDNILDDSNRCHGEWDKHHNFEADVQVIINEIPRMFEDLVMEDVDNTLDAIKKEAYHKNLSQCSNVFGGPCPYINYCHSKGKNMNGLQQNE